MMIQTIFEQQMPPPRPPRQPKSVLIPPSVRGFRSGRITPVLVVAPAQIKQTLQAITVPFGQTTPMIGAPPHASSETNTMAQKQAANLKLSLDFEALTEENLRLKRNLSGLNHLIEQTKHTNVENISKASQQGFKAGHSTVIKEIKKLWTTHEFAAELMYGEKHI